MSRCAVNIQIFLQTFFDKNVLGENWKIYTCSIAVCSKKKEWTLSWNFHHLLDFDWWKFNFLLLTIFWLFSAILCVLVSHIMEMNGKYFHCFIMLPRLRIIQFSFEWIFEKFIYLNSSTSKNARMHNLQTCNILKVFKSSQKAF